MSDRRYNYLSEARTELRDAFETVIENFLKSKRGLSQCEEDTKELFLFTRQYKTHIIDKSESLLNKQLKNWWNIKKLWGDWS